MTHARTLRIASLLAVAFFTLHWTDDVVRGMDRGGIAGIWGFLLLAVWLYAALVLTDRRAGLVTLLLFSLLGAAVPVLHMRGPGLASSRVVEGGAVFFWVWTLLALGVSASFSFLLAAHELWAQRRRSREAG